MPKNQFIITLPVVKVHEITSGKLIKIYIKLPVCLTESEALLQPRPVFLFSPFQARQFCLNFIFLKDEQSFTDFEINKNKILLRQSFSHGWRPEGQGQDARCLKRILFLFNIEV
jgi:hypothetical protein